MANIQIYQGNRVKDGKPVRGYAVQGTEHGKAFILIPASKDSFSVVEVDGESLVPVMQSEIRKC